MSIIDKIAMTRRQRLALFVMALILLASLGISVWINSRSNEPDANLEAECRNQMKEFQSAVDSAEIDTTLTRKSVKADSPQHKPEKRKQTTTKKSAPANPQPIKSF